ncbi:MAG: hypothetical protein HZA95_00065 [Candidatus Vogelbacteria bacterium]|nr:hypothetical protein [Candidatus Vogelbacteria bacterium]
MSIDNPSLEPGEESEYVPKLERVERTLESLQTELNTRREEANRGRTGSDESGKIHDLEQQIAVKKIEIAPKNNDTGAFNKPTPPSGSMLEKIQRLKQRRNEGLAHEA